MLERRVSHYFGFSIYGNRTYDDKKAEEKRRSSKEKASTVMGVRRGGKGGVMLPPWKIKIYHRWSFNI